MLHMSATFITLYYKLMMTSAFVQMFTLPFFVSCADTQHTHQRKILCNFFDVPSLSVLPREITGFSWSSEDFCRWRTVDCADGAVTSIHYQRERHPISLWIHWLPPTATYVHLSNVKLRQGASTVQLPRALQYLCLSQCDTDMRDSVPAIDLRRLPARLEELIIINCRFRGNFDLIFLPCKLRLLILNIPVFNLRVCVNYENLPDSLHLACIQNGFEQRSIKFVAGGKVNSDKRVVTAYDPRRLNKDSNYYQFYQQKVEEAYFY